MKCANCGKEIIAGSRNCPVCNSPVSDFMQIMDPEEFNTVTGDLKTSIDFGSGQNKPDPPVDDLTYVDSPYHTDSWEKTAAENYHMDLPGQDRDRTGTSNPDDSFSRARNEESTVVFFEHPEQQSFDNEPDFQGYGVYDGKEADSAFSGGFYSSDGSFYGEDPSVYGHGSPPVPPSYMPPAGKNEKKSAPEKKGWKKRIRKIAAITAAILLLTGVSAYGAVHHHNKVRAQRVVRMIDQLGKPEEVELEDRNDIDIARSAFDELTDNQKEMVDNDLSLFSAESVVKQLEKKEEQKDLSEEELGRQERIRENHQGDLDRKSKKVKKKPYYYVMSDPVSWGAYEVVTKSGPLTLRTGPGKDYKKSARMPKGSIVYVYGYYNGWYYLDYDGLWGWARAKYLKELDDMPLVSETSSYGSAGYLEVEENPSNMGEYEIIVDEQHLRSGPGTDYASQAIMKKEDQVTAYGSYNDWLYIEYDGQMGWANGKSKYMKAVRTEKIPPEAREIMDDPHYKGEFTVNANNLTLRTGPGTGFKQIKVLKRGEIVNGYDSFEDWKYVEFNDKWGWMKEEYLEKVDKAGQTSEPDEPDDIDRKDEDQEDQNDDISGIDGSGYDPSDNSGSTEESSGGGSSSESSGDSSSSGNNSGSSGGSSGSSGSSSGGGSSSGSSGGSSSSSGNSSGNSGSGSGSSGSSSGGSGSGSSSNPNENPSEGVTNE